MGHTAKANDWFPHTTRFGKRVGLISGATPDSYLQIDAPPHAWWK